MNNSSFITLIKYTKLYKQDIIIVMISVVCVSGSLLMLGQTFRLLIDHGLSQKYKVAIDNSILSICALIVVFGISSFFRSYFINNVAEKIVSRIRNETISNLLQLDIAYFEDSKLGSIISCLIADVELIAKLIVDLLSFAVRNTLMLAGSIVLMFINNPKLSLIVLAIVPILLVPILKLGRYVRTLSKNTLALQSDIAASLAEQFTNIRTLYAFNQQQYQLNEFINQTNNYLQYTSRRLKIRAIFFAISISTILSTITAVIWIGSNDIIAATISSGQMVSFIYYSIIAGLSAGGIAEFIGEAQKPLAALDRVFDLQHSRTHQENQLTPEPTRQDVREIDRQEQYIIEFNNIYFAYPNRPLIHTLNNLSFKISKGKFTAIVGRSGAGKSTIMQLLLKFYTPSSGAITIEKHNVATTCANALRTFIAYVPQDPSIFSGTIKSNIAFSKPTANEEEIMYAANVTGIADFANGLAEGLNTRTGENGARLSGGQRQRIAISRAILYQPEILLLDEATSALDSESEQRLCAKLQNIMQGKTIISIAHRISSVENADEILVIDKGALVAQGTHAHLLATSSIYRLLCEEQIINFA